MVIKHAFVNFNSLCDFISAANWQQSRWQGLDRFNTLRPRQDGRHFPDDIFKPLFLNKNAWILIKISLKFVPKGPIDNIPALVQIMAWHRPGDRPLSEPRMVSLPKHICVTRPQWVNSSPNSDTYMRQSIGSALVQITACRLFGAKWYFNQNIKIFIHQKCIWKYRL